MAAVLERPMEELIGVAVTWEQFLAWTEDSDFEYVDGRIVGGELTTRQHAILVQLFSRTIGNLTYDQNLGTTFGEQMVISLDGSGSGRCPDVSYVRTENSDRISDTYIAGAADFVLEVVSPGSRRRDTLEKRAEYEAGGIEEYWIIDPERRQSTFLRIRDGRYEPIEPDADGRISSTVIPGLRVLPDALWTEPKPSASALIDDVVSS